MQYLVDLVLLVLGLDDLVLAPEVECKLPVLLDLVLQALDALLVRSFELLLDLESELLEVLWRRELLLETLECPGFGFELSLPLGNQLFVLLVRLDLAPGVMCTGETVAMSA